MRNFVIKKKMSLAFLGEGWDDAYINFQPLGFQDLDTLKSLDVDADDGLAAADKIMELLSNKFLDGKGPLEGTMVDLTSEDMKAFGIEFIGQAVNALSGTVSPNSEAPSN